MFSLRSNSGLKRPGRQLAVLNLETFEDRTAPAVGIGANFPGFRDDFNPPFGNTGAIGPNHYVEFVTGGFAVFNRAGVVIEADFDVNFWVDAGIPAGDVGNVTFLPRVMYDSLSDRWFATAISAVQATDNLILVARSDTGDPTGTWQAVSYVGSPAHFFALDPTLGVDANGVYIGSINITNVSGGFVESMTMTSIPKADLLLPTPTLANMTIVEEVWPDLLMGWAPTGVTNFAPQVDHASVLAVDAFDFGLVNRTTITGTEGPFAQFGQTINHLIQHTEFPGLSRQPDGSRVMQAGDDRFSGTVYQVGDLIYMAQSISVDASGFAFPPSNQTTNAVRVTVLSDSLDQVVAEGTWFSPNFDYSFPSLAVNEYGDMLIGFSRSGPNQGSGATDGNLGAYAVYAHINPADPTSITFGPEIQLQAGLVNNYNLTGGDESNPELWGLYSATNPDPTNPLAFWTTQEFAFSATEWRTQISQVFVSPRVQSVSSPLANGSLRDGLRHRHYHFVQQ